MPEDGRFLWPGLGKNLPDGIRRQRAQLRRRLDQDGSRASPNLFELPCV